MRAFIIMAAALLAACGSKPGGDEAKANSGASGAAANPAAGAGAAGGIGTNSFTAQVVDIDGKGGTITLRSPSASANGASAAIRRVSLAGAAKEQLAGIKAGDQVIVGCDDADAPAASPAGGGVGERPTSSGPDGADSGIGPSGTDSLTTCRAVRSVTPVGG